MNPALIMREEIVCLIILLFLFFMAKAFKMGKDSKAFNRLTWFAVLHVVFDIITLITVNNQDIVPNYLNTVCHLIFYMTAILFANEICCYILNLCYKNTYKNIYWVGHALLFIYMIVVLVLGIEYRYIHGIFTSTGMAAYIGFGFAFCYFILALVTILINRNKLERMTILTIVPMMLVLLISEIVQILVPQFLFTGGAVTIVTVAFFFSLENPAIVFKKKAMIDAMTGVKSRQSYDIDIAEIEKKFEKTPNLNCIFVFCDINNLKSINGLFGHLEGDRYITLVAKVLMQEFKHAQSIYRMGGDEFFVIFHNVNEQTVIKECKAVQKSCMETDPGKAYTPAVAIGYAVLSSEYKSVHEVVRAADFMMYRNKAELKGSKTFLSEHVGTKINPIGLIDVVFDAMCSANDRIYPFIMNIETGITRISTKWKDEFGLEDEFFENFDVVWNTRIHPDDRKAYTDDIVATMSGRQKYHNRDYRAKNTKGEYVYCTCHGAIYKGKNGEPDIFSGYVINHGIKEKIDAATGLRNYYAVDEVMQKVVNNKEHVIVLKIGINNFERLNMLYEYSLNEDAIRAIIQVIESIVSNKGETFCNEGKDITIIFRNVDREEVADIYSNISSSLAKGIGVMGTIIPLNISGGAAEVLSDNSYKKDMIRSSLLYALDESRYFQHNKLVFTDYKQDGVDEPKHKLQRQVHRDATSGADAFRLRYQPVIDTQSGKVVGAEALLRWISTDYGEVLPGRFIDFLETDSCYYELGLRIIRRAIRDAVEIRKYLPDFHIGINITAQQVRNDSFIGSVLNILEEYSYPPEGVVIELTERSKELTEKFLKEKIVMLRSKGFRVALDDMGTGYSTTGLLLNMPADEVKLDSKFVRKLTNKKQYQMFVRMLAEASSQNVMQICFEGIEDKETYEFIKQYGNSYCQGFYFAKPLFIEELKKYIENNNTGE